MLIYITGIDGCGKTTQARLLADTLKGHGYNAGYLWLRWEPTLNKLINLLRWLQRDTLESRCSKVAEHENREEQSWLKKKKLWLSNPVIRQLWMTYASLDYYIQYRRSFGTSSPRILILDRYLDDFIIDQAINLGITPDKAGMLRDYPFLRRFRSPDLRIIIDLPPHEGYLRKQDGTSMTYLMTRTAYYQTLAGMNGSEKFDGMMDIEPLHTEIAACVLRHMKGI